MYIVCHKDKASLEIIPYQHVFNCFALAYTWLMFTGILNNAAINTFVYTHTHAYMPNCIYGKMNLLNREEIFIRENTNVG